MTNAVQLREQVREIIRTPVDSDDDKVQRRTRWTEVARRALMGGPGNIVEIGALAGDSTVPFCMIAEEFGRKVLVIDPWLAPTHNVAGWEYGTFMERTKKWRDVGVLDVYKGKSQDEVAIQRLQSGLWAFALVDGSHAYTDVLRDIMSVKGAQVICCDDMNMDGVYLAFGRAVEMMPGRAGIYDETLGRKWEGYIV